MEGDLKAILDGTDTDEVVETPAPEVVEEAEQTESEKGEVVPQEAPAQAVTPPAESDEVRGLKAALKEERRKRQELARERAEAKQFDPQVLYQDPSEIVNFVSVQQRNTAINMSREFAKEQYDDYEEMEELFAEEAERNPALVTEMLQHAAPALFAYKTAKHLKTVKEAQDGSLEARLRAQITAELEAKYAGQPKPPVTIPTDLSNVRSAKSTEDFAPESLDSILQRK